MQTVGFEDYIEPLQMYLVKFREAEVGGMICERGVRGWFVQWRWGWLVEALNPGMQEHTSCSGRN
jgi:hypothetical protein